MRLQGFNVCLIPTEWLWLDGVGVTSWGGEMRHPSRDLPLHPEPCALSLSSCNANLAADVFEVSQILWYVGFASDRPSKRLS